MVTLAKDRAAETGCEWLHVDFDPGIGAVLLAACGFTATGAGLISLTSESQIQPLVDRPAQLAPGSSPSAVEGHVVGGEEVGRRPLPGQVVVEVLSAASDIRERRCGSSSRSLIQAARALSVSPSANAPASLPKPAPR